MSDLRITAIGTAEIPLKIPGRRYKIVRVEIVDKGEPTCLGDFSLIDLLQALNALDGEPVVVEEARFSGHLKLYREENSDG